jgi:hypothetical protein
VDPNKKVEHEPPKTISGTARQMTEILRRIGMNPKITWLPKGLVRGEPPENEGVEGLEYDEFRPYDVRRGRGFHRWAVANASSSKTTSVGTTCVLPVGPKALTEGIGKFVNEAQWMKGEGGIGEEERA